MAFAIAAVAREAADGMDVISSGGLDAALQRVDEEIMALMTTCSLHSFATKYSNIMLRYVYLRRALRQGPSVAKVRTHQPLSNQIPPSPILSY